MTPASIAALQEKAQQWAGKLDGQDAGVKAKGRKLSESGAKARLYHPVCEAHLAKIVKVDPVDVARRQGLTRR